MSNKKNLKEIFDEKLNKDMIYNDILINVQRKENNKMKYYKILPIPICIIMLVCTCLTLKQQTSPLKEDTFTNNVKVYTYMSSNNEITNNMQELKENIKIKLSKYNNLMSSVPGYPISFVLEKNNNLDYISINVKNGSILEWENETGQVNEKKKSYNIRKDKTLYFKVNKNTIITITGVKNKKNIFEKSITITEDQDFNYYAVLK